MAGFNVPTQFPPELLAQIAAASFKPPQAMNMPGLSVPTGPPPAPGLNVGDGMAALSAGLPFLKDFLTGFKGDPSASAAYGSPRGPIPADVIARGGWIGGGI